MRTNAIGAEHVRERSERAKAPDQRAFDSCRRRVFRDGARYPPPVVSVRRRHSPARARGSRGDDVRPSDETWFRGRFVNQAQARDDARGAPRGRGASSREGNARFRAGDVLGAEHKYARASAYFTVMSAESPLDPRPAAQNAEATAAAAPVYNNLALCLSCRGAWAEAAEACTELLDLRPDDRKALLRRARARVELELLDEAESDLARVVALGPASEHVRAFARDVRARLADARRGRDARDARARGLLRQTQRSTTLPGFGRPRSCRRRYRPPRFVRRRGRRRAGRRLSLRRRAKRSTCLGARPRRRNRRRRGRGAAAKTRRETRRIQRGVALGRDAASTPFVRLSRSRGRVVGSNGMNRRDDSRAALQASPPHRSPSRRALPRSRVLILGLLSTLRGGFSGGWRVPCRFPCVLV